MTPLLRKAKVSLPPSSVQAEGRYVTPPFLIVTKYAWHWRAMVLAGGLVHQADDPSAGVEQEAGQVVVEGHRRHRGLRRDLLVSLLASACRPPSGRGPLEVREHFLRR